MTGTSEKAIREEKGIDRNSLSLFSKAVGWFVPKTTSMNGDDEVDMVLRAIDDGWSRKELLSANFDPGDLFSRPHTEDATRQ